ncbi:expressed unknown protein [Seminavis robusta]|uniref:Uncharacterized protein n=1 Tax=Seminavis robusta TaxID=568900 RepID=A0A9N8HFM1_9STRA|nr:expressed unknown protein [Seminavis robusta]|eukprot:Sro441_g143700.1 n/a (122) ;mRNA; f:42104-42469
MGSFLSSLVLTSCLLFATCPDANSFEARRELRTMVRELHLRDRGSTTKNMIARGLGCLTASSINHQIDTAKMHSKFTSYGLFQVVEVSSNPSIWSNHRKMEWIGICGSWWPLFSVGFQLID